MIQKLFCLFAFSAFIAVSLHAQNLTEAEITGTWSVSKINVLINDVRKEQQGKLNMLKKAFMNARFTFGTGNKFSFDISFKELKIKNGHWKQDKSTKTFIIQEWKDKDTNKSLLMEIAARKDGDKVLFLMSETFFELEMRKN